MQPDSGIMWKLNSKIKVCFENERTLPKLYKYRSTQINNNTFKANKERNSLKSDFDMV